MSDIKLNKQEIRDIEKAGYDLNELLRPEGQAVHPLILISNGRRQLHDSGYPFIRVFGVDEETGKLVDLGWHDHLYIYVNPANIDSLGKNIFQIMRPSSSVFKVSEGFRSVSTLEVGNIHCPREDPAMIW